MTPGDLRALRHRLGLTQTELAKLLDVQNFTISRWETGVQPHPRAAGLLLLAWEKYPDLLESLPIP